MHVHTPSGTDPVCGPQACFFFVAIEEEVRRRKDQVDDDEVRATVGLQRKQTDDEVAMEPRGWLELRRLEHVAIVVLYCLEILGNRETMLMYCGLPVMPILRRSSSE